MSTILIFVSLIFFLKYGSYTNLKEIFLLMFVAGLRTSLHGNVIECCCLQCTLKNMQIKIYWPGKKTEI